MTRSKIRIILAELVSLSAILSSFQLAYAQSALAPIPKTGQTKCWSGSGSLIDCKGTGQDGEIQAGAAWPNPRFTDNRNGTVTDNLSGLTWVQAADCLGRAAWADALKAAAALANGRCGLTDQSRAGDWRLPNIIELRSLADFGSYNPALPAGHPFKNFESAVYWSSSTVPAFPALGWFSTMAVGPHVFDLKVNTFRVLPVKGGLGSTAKLPRTGQTRCFDTAGATIPCAGTGQDGELQTGVAWPNPRFKDNGDGTVRDNLTALIWLKNAHCFGFRSWADALKDANGLGEGQCGLVDKSKPGDWRLPNTRELISVMDISTVAPALPIGHPFANLQPTLYWTSTSGQNFPVMAFFSLMSAGSTVFDHKDAELGAWAVRTEK